MWKSCEPLCRHFGDFRIRIVLSRNNKCLRVSSFLWPHLLHFVGPKMRNLLGRDTHSFLWAFWRPEVSIDVDSWKPRSRVPRTAWAHFRFFGGLKTRFLPSCETHGSRDRIFFWAHFRHLGASKCYFCQVVDHTIQTYLAFCKIIFCISVAQKCFFSRVAEHISRVPIFVWANFLQIGVLKKRFLTSREIHY